MKHTLTDADRLELKSLLNDLWANARIHSSDEREVNDFLHKSVQLFSEFYESKNTFSDSIDTDGKNCPTCGALWIISKRYLPSYLVKPLRILEESGRAMTTKELTDITKNRQVYTKFAWLVHWNLVEKVGKALFSITEKGRQFLRGEITVPDFQWMLKNKVVATPEGRESPESVYAYQLSPTDTEDHAEHVERSAPAGHAHVGNPSEFMSSMRGLF